MRKIKIEQLIQSLHMRERQRLPLESPFIDVIDEFVATTIEEANFHIDPFPVCIENDKKYIQVEIFYQRAKEEKEFRKNFLNVEYRLHKVVETLWLYDEVFALFTGNSVNRYMKNPGVRREKYIIKPWIRYLNYLRYNTEVKHQLCRIDDLDFLRCLLHIATREMDWVCLYFQMGMVLYLKESRIIVYLENEKMMPLIKRVVAANGLYILPRIIVPSSASM